MFFSSHFISVMSCVTFRCESLVSGDSMTHPVITVETFDVRGAARTQEVLKSRVNCGATKFLFIQAHQSKFFLQMHSFRKISFSHANCGASEFEHTCHLMQSLVIFVYRLIGAFHVMCNQL